MGVYEVGLINQKVRIQRVISTNEKLEGRNDRVEIWNGRVEKLEKSNQSRTKE